MRRRSVLQLLVMAASLGQSAHAMQRVRSGGRLELCVPLPLSTLDPHAAADLDAAVFGDAVFDSLYSLDASGRPYPALAEGLPELDGGAAQLRLRPQLVSAQGRRLDARDVIASLERARALAAGPLLADVGRLRSVPREPLTMRVEGVTTEPAARALAVALASPLAAIVPRGFDPRRPDGTGPFQVRQLGGTLRLERNPRAARGPGFLDAIDVTSAVDLSTALRAFEAGEVDVGWLASGLHQARARAQTFKGPRLGYIVLRTSARLGPWGAPGVAQSLLDGLESAPLTALGVHPVLSTRATPVSWRGPGATLSVDATCPQLRSIAQSVAATLAGPSAAITLVPVAPAALRRDVEQGDFDLALDFVRSPQLTLAEDVHAIADAAGLHLAPRAREPLGALTRRMRLGVVGALHVQGAHLKRFGGIARWSLADAHLAAP